MSEALERINASYQNLMESIDGLTEEQLSAPSAIGEWSVKDVLSHTAYWNEQALEGTERRLRGEQQPDDGEDFQAVNERVQVERADWPLARVTESLTQVHDRFVAITTEHPELSPQDIGTDVYEHVDEHAAEVRDWRARAGL